MENEMDFADPTPHLQRFNSYQQACLEFRWVIPERLNVANAICRRHNDAVSRIALTEMKEGGFNTYTFGSLDFLSDKFATALSESGITQGDSVAVVLPPSAGLAIVHLAVLKNGAVIVPLSTGSDATLLRCAIADSAAKAVVVDESSYAAVYPHLSGLPNLESRFVVSDLRPVDTKDEVKDFWSEVDRSSPDFSPVDTDVNSAALIFYVETQGEVTGIVHTHRSVISQLAAFEMLNGLEFGDESVFCTGYDVSSVNSLLGIIYPAWWYGCSFAAYGSENRDELRSMQSVQVTHVLLPTTQLNSFLEARSRKPYELKLKRIVTDGPFSRELIEAGSTDPDMKISEVFARPQTGFIATTCDRWFETGTNGQGWSTAGRLIAIVDDDGNVLRANEKGNIAVHRSDPGLFSGYHDSEATESAFIAGWYLIGDYGYLDKDGYLFVSQLRRKDYPPRKE